MTSIANLDISVDYGIDNEQDPLPTRINHCLKRMLLLLLLLSGIIWVFIFSHPNGPAIVERAVRSYIISLYIHSYTNVGGSSSNATKYGRPKLAMIFYVIVHSYILSFLPVIIINNIVYIKRSRTRYKSRLCFGINIRVWVY